MFFPRFSLILTPAIVFFLNCDLFRDWTSINRKNLDFIHQNHELLPHMIVTYGWEGIWNSGIWLLNTFFFHFSFVIRNTQLWLSWGYVTKIIFYPRFSIWLLHIAFHAPNLGILLCRNQHLLQMNNSIWLQMLSECDCCLQFIHTELSMFVDTIEMSFNLCLLCSIYGNYHNASIN